MATPFETAAERIAPTRAATNYFDPAPGQSVMSRYANAGAAVLDSEVAAEAADRLMSTRDALDRRKANRIALSLEEEDFQEKQGFRTQRGEFLESIAAIDPAADDFEDQISGLYKSLPPAALRDDAVVDMLSFKRKRADDLLNENQMVARQEETFQNRVAFEERKARNRTLLSGLSPEELQGLRDPVSGELDLDQALFLAGQKVRDNKLVDQQIAREPAEQRADRRETRELTEKEIKARDQEITDLVEGDLEAFPRHSSMYKTKIDSDGNIVPENSADLPEYLESRQRDKGAVKAETLAARDAATAEDFILMAVPTVGADGAALTAEQRAELAKALPEKVRTRRAKVWELANGGSVAEAEAPAKPSAAAPASGKVKVYNPATRKLE